MSSLFFPEKFILRSQKFNSIPKYVIEHLKIDLHIYAKYISKQRLKILFQINYSKELKYALL